MSNRTVEDAKKILDNNWNRQIILYGPPGTSKTYSATIIAAKMLGYEGDDYKEAEAHLAENKGRYKLIQFHPSYSYEDFVRGVSVKPNAGGGVTYEPEDKIFGDFCKKAADDKGKKNPYVLVIDEINRAPLASVLGELIYGLEYRGQPVDTPYAIEDGDYTLTVPENLYIIGTMNTADRSIGSIDYAVRRRFAFVHVPSEPLKIEGSWEYIGGVVEHLYKELMNPKTGIFGEEHNLLEDLEMDVEDIKIGHTYFLGKKKGESQEDKPSKEDEKAKEDEIAYMNYRIKYQIKPIYMEYIKDGLIKKEGEKIFEKIIEKWEDWKPELK